jgi:tetratricopeptide (TPR) repeat protein
MIEQAFVSGRLGKAVFSDKGILYALDRDGSLRIASQGEIQDVFLPRGEFKVVSNIQIPALEAMLSAETQRHDALFLTLSLLDSSLSLSTRIAVAQALESFFSDSGLRSITLQRVASVPLPLDVRAARKSTFNVVRSFAEIHAVLHEIFELQPVLDEVWSSWLAVAQSDVPAQVVSEIQSRFVERGLFADAAFAIRRLDPLGLNSVFVTAAVDARLGQILPNSRQVLMMFRTDLHKKYFRQVRQSELPGTRSSKHAAIVSRGTPDYIASLLDNIEERTIKPDRLKPFESKQRVDRQIEGIREMLFAGKTSIAEKYLEELITFQITHGEREHIVKSLCSLTAIAIEANQLGIADQLSQYAMRVDSEDPVVYSVRAETFKNRGLFESALKIYGEAIAKFSNNRYALNGYADVLKEMGRFEEALDLYAKTQKQFRDNPVAFNGHAGVLKAKGLHQEALKEALETTKRFRTDAISRSTLAWILGSLGKYEEASRNYQLALQYEPNNVRIVVGYSYALKASGKLSEALGFLDSRLSKYGDVATLLNAKATLLRQCGRLREALSVYELTAKTFPTYLPSQFGAAAVKILLGQVEEAREYLPEQNLESELDWSGFRTFALSYVRAGQFEEAVRKLQFGIENCRWLQERTRFETCLGFVELKRSRLKASIAILQKGLDRLDRRDKDTRLVLLGHAQAELGEREIASALLKRLFISSDPELKNTRDAVVSSYGLNGAREKPFMASLELAEAELSLAMAA